MQNAVIVVGKSHENVHMTAAKFAALWAENNGYTPYFINTAAVEDHNVLKYHMQQNEPELLITFDCAGFNLRLLGGDLFYNSLCCPALHILFDRTVFYEGALSERMNFITKIITLGKEDAEYAIQNYKRVPDASVLDVDAYFGDNYTMVNPVNKSIDILIPDSLIPKDYVMEEINRILSHEEQKMCCKIIDYFHNCPDHNIYDEFGTGVLEKNTRPVSLAHKYLHMERLERIAGAFINDGIPFWAPGDGWREVFTKPGTGNFMHFDSYDTDQRFELLKLSKTVIDVHPERPDINTVTSILAKFTKTYAIESVDWNLNCLYKDISEALS